MAKLILRDFWKDTQCIWSLASLFSTDKKKFCAHQLLHGNAKNPTVQDPEHASLAGGGICFGSHLRAFHLRLLNAVTAYLPEKGSLKNIALVCDKASYWKYDASGFWMCTQKMTNANVAMFIFMCFYTVWNNVQSSPNHTTVYIAWNYSYYLTVCGLLDCILCTTWFEYIYIWSVCPLDDLLILHSFIFISA